MTDEVLVRQIVKGDSEAFEVLFTRYQETVCAQINRIVRDTATADDLVQEVFLRVWNRAGQWQGQGLFRAWLLRIATNLALNHLRSKKRRRERPLEIPAVLPEHEEEDTPAPGWMVDRAALGPDALLEQAEQKQLLQKVIDGLPEEKREVFRLVHDAEMELREVADRLAIPEGTVKSRLYHARRRIAREWQEVEKQWETIECL